MKQSEVGRAGKGVGAGELPGQRPQHGRGSAAFFPQWERGEEWEADVDHDKLRLRNYVCSSANF